MTTRYKMSRYCHHNKLVDSPRALMSKSKQEHLKAFAIRMEAVRRHYGTKTSRPRLLKSHFAAELEIEAKRYLRYERGEAEPPFEVLTRIKRLSGISLDWLICDEPPGSKDLSRPHAAVTVAQRLTWAREIMEPFAPSCAAVMRVPTTQWQRYEDGKDALPVEVAREFAHRFSVDLDYLYSGDLDGIAPAVRDSLIARHPVLDRPSFDQDIDLSFRPFGGARSEVVSLKWPDGAVIPTAETVNMILSVYARLAATGVAISPAEVARVMRDVLARDGADAPHESPPPPPQKPARATHNRKATGAGNRRRPAKVDEVM